MKNPIALYREFHYNYRRYPSFLSLQINAFFLFLDIISLFLCSNDLCVRYISIGVLMFAGNVFNNIYSIRLEKKCHELRKKLCRIEGNKCSSTMSIVK